MKRHPLSQLNLPSFSTIPFEQWDQTDTPLITLKHLSNNLSYLEQQFHKKILPKQSQLVKEKPKYLSVPIRQLLHKQNRELPRIFSSIQAVEIKQKIYKRSISVTKESREQTSRQEGVMSVRKGGKDFSEMRGLFPLQNKQEEMFLHKHKKMNISRALNLNKRRNKTAHKLLYQGIQNDLIGAETGPMSPSHLGVRLLC